MPEQTTITTDESTEVDVRGVPKPQRHPLIFERFAALAVDESFVLINSHDPKHLRQEFDRDHPGTHTWEYLESGPVWRIRIGRRSNAELPRILADTRNLTAQGPAGDAAGAVWKLDVNQRHLDANIIYLQAGTEIQSHTGPDLDVLLHIVDGDGELATDTGALPLTPGELVWLPRQTRRSITAGPAGLRYLSVHPRRPALNINTAHQDT
jgi:uncharacterized protein (DUF2249 family)/quercetin dioxygenase-like cupin family protein